MRRLRKPGRRTDVAARRRATGGWFTSRRRNRPLRCAGCSFRASCSKSTSGCWYFRAKCPLRLEASLGAARVASCRASAWAARFLAHSLATPEAEEWTSAGPRVGYRALPGEQAEFRVDSWASLGGAPPEVTDQAPPATWSSRATSPCKPSSEALQRCSLETPSKDSLEVVLSPRVATGLAAGSRLDVCPTPPEEMPLNRRV
jgi:hypothetical protein